MTAIGRADTLEDPHFGDWFQRKEHETALRAIIEEALTSADAKTWERRLNDAGAPCAAAGRAWAPLACASKTSVQRERLASRGVLQMDRVEAVDGKILRWPDGPGG